MPATAGRRPSAKRNLSSGNIIQYYYNNFHNLKNAKQTNAENANMNVYNNNVLQRRRNELAFLHGKAPFSSTKRPLSIRLSTPKHVVNFLAKTFRSDSQKRPLLLLQPGGGVPADGPLLSGAPARPKAPSNRDKGATFKVSSSIYTISESVEKFSLYKKNLYISSNSRPLFVRK